MAPGAAQLNGKISLVHGYCILHLGTQEVDLDLELQGAVEGMRLHKRIIHRPNQETKEFI